MGLLDLPWCYCRFMEIYRTAKYVSFSLKIVSALFWEWVGGGGHETNPGDNVLVERTNHGEEMVTAEFGLQLVWRSLHTLLLLPFQQIIKHYRYSTMLLKSCGGILSHLCVCMPSAEYWLLTTAWISVCSFSGKISEVGFHCLVPGAERKWLGQRSHSRLCAYSETRTQSPGFLATAGENYLYSGSWTHSVRVV